MTPLLHLLAEETRSDVRWRHMPAPWVVALVIIPLLVLLSWWAYRRDTEVARGPRVLMGGLRAAALGLFLLVLFGPYAELYDTRVVRSHLVVLVDASQSMATVDGYENEDARALAAASGLPSDQVSSQQRLEIVKRVLGNEKTALLDKWTGAFRLHVFAFGAQTTPIVSTGDSETATDDPASLGAEVRKRLGEIQATDPATRIGQAVQTVCDTFHARDEQVAGVLVLSDGQDNGQVVTMLQAGRKAAAMHVPVYAVGVGDPRSPKNIHVGNLRAKEVVLARDDTVFEFGVRAKGFEGRAVKIEMWHDQGAGRQRPLPIVGGDVVLNGGDTEQEVRFKHRFLEAGIYTLRIGIPVQDGEKIKSDNYALHTLRVIDRKIKVLYVDASPRWEFLYLANALVRDPDTMLAHTLLLDSDPNTPQKRTQVPGWEPLDASDGFPLREKLFEYDVVILGDVEPGPDGGFAPTEEKARDRLHDLRDFVDRGGGLIVIAGVQNNPTRYRNTELQALLPVVIDRHAEDKDPDIDERTGFGFKITPEGRDSPMMNVYGDPDHPEKSVEGWEKDADWRQYWSYPALRAKTLAKVLAVSALPAHDDSRYGPRPLIATMLYGRGRVLYIGVEELWRLRKEAADRYFYRFYGEAVRFLATYKLLGGNKRFKIVTDRDQYQQDDIVRITLDVLDKDYEPSKAPYQTITIEMPGSDPARRETVETQVPANPDEPGTYRREIHPTRPGEYRLRAATDDPNDQAPEKTFRVVESTVEGRDLLLDEARLREMADASEGGRYLLLADLPALQIPSKEKLVRTDKHEQDLWDDWWTLAVAVSLLAAEWLLRKRYNLV